MIRGRIWQRPFSYGSFPDLTCREAAYLAGWDNDVTTLLHEKHLSAGPFYSLELVSLTYRLYSTTVRISPLAFKEPASSGGLKDSRQPSPQNSSQNIINTSLIIPRTAPLSPTFALYLSYQNFVWIKHPQYRATYRLDKSQITPTFLDHSINRASLPPRTITSHRPDVNLASVIQTGLCSHFV